MVRLQLPVNPLAMKPRLSLPPQPQAGLLVVALRIADAYHRGLAWDLKMMAPLAAQVRQHLYLQPRAF